MITLDTDQAPQDNAGAASDAALSGLVGLARLSRLTLLYHGPVGSDGGREQAAALARASSGDIAVLFDAGSDMPLPDLLSAIEEAVLEAKPQAPLAPPMAGPVEALLAWQQALDLRFLLVFYRFDAALARPDAAFEAELLRLVRDPALDLSLLLLMDEAAAPLLERLRAELPDLGEDYLRLPEPAAAAALRGSALMAEPEPILPASLFASPLTPLRDEPMADMPPEPAPSTPDWLQRQEPTLAPFAAPFWPEPASDQDDDSAPATADAPAGPQAPRRRRPFPSLLEQAAPDLSFDADDTRTADEPTAPAAPDARLEPVWTAPEQGGAPAYREPRPLPLAAWMHKRQGRRRRATMALASAAGMSGSILFFFMLVLALLCWELPQLH
ncbi:hypothetical protein [Noviherbaspirillum soli]|uniref:hypothetical protein n=1 Tax=Noviherbaspirillum soli TaxID=1064518 RepID=UPI001889E111|nr:hypothetical protein [Noviherbaspirillum soli]